MTNTEEETFRKLKQSPYEQLRDLLSSMPVSRFCIAELLNDNNWTYTEFDIRDRAEYKRSWPVITSVYTYPDIYHKEIKECYE
jgi:hypothetical protein